MLSDEQDFHPQYLPFSVAKLHRNLRNSFVLVWFKFENGYGKTSAVCSLKLAGYPTASHEALVEQGLLAGNISVRSEFTKRRTTAAI